MMNQNFLVGSETAYRVLDLINLFGKISFDEFNAEIRNIQVMGFWCCLHELKNRGFIGRDINGNGEIEFSLTDKGKEYFEKMAVNRNKEII